MTTGPELAASGHTTSNTTFWAEQNWPSASRDKTRAYSVSQPSASPHSLRDPNLQTWSQLMRPVLHKSTWAIGKEPPRAGGSA